MHENNINYILVSNSKNELVGIIDEANLFDAVIKKSFTVKISNYVKRLKKIQYNESITDLVKVLQKNENVFIYRKNKIFGIISRVDLLWYLKRKQDAC